MLPQRRKLDALGKRRTSELIKTRTVHEENSWSMYNKFWESPLRGTKKYFWLPESTFKLKNNQPLDNVRDDADRSAFTNPLSLEYVQVPQRVTPHLRHLSCLVRHQSKDREISQAPIRLQAEATVRPQSEASIRPQSDLQRHQSGLEKPQPGLTRP